MRQRVSDHEVRMRRWAAPVARARGRSSWLIGRGQISGQCVTERFDRRTRMGYLDSRLNKGGTVESSASLVWNKEGNEWANNEQTEGNEPAPEDALTCE